MRRVEQTDSGFMVVSDERPAISIQIAQHFAYVGSTQFVLSDTVQAQVLVFADVDADQRMQRIVQIHFEHFLDSVPDKAYRYQIEQTVELGGHRYMTDTRCAPASLFQDEANYDPASDMIRIKRFIEGQGYILPYHEQQLIWTRFIRVVGDDRRAELLIIYKEPHPHAEPTTAEANNFLVSAAALESPLLTAYWERVLSSFEVLR